ncbi:MAG: undecaprenyldiphospho-muramoylpentapeptide beta-N-acetylglucosaminyltransferase [Candidatus Spechtbacterales bacterium]
MRIILAGGGTGGHIFPLIAVSRQLYIQAKREKKFAPDVVFVGPADRHATELFIGNNIKVRRIAAGKWRRYFSFLNIFDSIKILMGLVQAFVHLWWYMPDVVFSKGGYGSFPVVIISRLFRIPVVIHESDSVSGAVNRILARFADKVLVSFPIEFPNLPKNKTVFIGNPVRDLGKGNKQFAKTQLNIKTNKPVILFLGGSQGALQINSLILSALKELTTLYEVIHQTGDRHYDAVVKYAKENLSTQNRDNYHIFATLNEIEMKNVFTAVDIIISRAGAGAIFEIAQLGKPGILIPLENSAGGHQEKNAEIYQYSGACVILSRSNVIPHILLSQISGIINDKNKAEQMSRAASKFAKPDAAKNIALLLLNYGK